jgi:hypothetical protein
VTREIKELPDQSHLAPPPAWQTRRSPHKGQLQPRTETKFWHKENIISFLLEFRYGVSRVPER